MSKLPQDSAKRQERETSAVWQTALTNRRRAASLDRAPDRPASRRKARDPLPTAARPPLRIDPPPRVDADTRTVPHDTAAERSLLGGLLLENARWSEIVGRVTAEDFFRQAHQFVFAALADRQAQGAGLDVITLKDDLSARGQLAAVGGPAYLAGLLDGVPRGAHLADYADIVRRDAKHRRIIDLGRAVVDAAYRLDDTADLLRTLQDTVTVPTASAPLTQGLDELGTADAAAAMLVPGLIPAVGLTLLHGQPRTLKSWVLLDLAVAFATGADALGFLPVDAVRTVLYVTNEDGRAFVGGRVGELLRGRGADLDPTRLRFLVHSRPGPWLDDPAGQRWLLDAVRQCGATVVMLDPLRSLSACVDKGPGELQPLACALRQLHTETGAAVLMTHHDQKPQVGVQDHRDRAQKASGGGLFSIADAPIHIERIDEGTSQLVPDNWKLCQTPRPLTVTLHRVDGQTARFDAHALDAPQAVLSEPLTRTLALVKAHPGLSGRELAKRLNTSRPTATGRLRDLEARGLVECIKGALNADCWSAVILDS